MLISVTLDKEKIKRKHLYKSGKSKSNDLNEDEIIRGCIREDKACQVELYSRNSGKLFSVCLRYARNRMEAEDLLQDSFIKIFDNISKFKGHGSFEGWMRRITVNTALKNYNKSSFQKERIGLEDYEGETVEPTVVDKMGVDELMNLVSNLPEGYRLVFNLYVIDGYSHKEIGAMLNIKESTSRSQLVKARNTLQNQIIDLQKISYEE